VTNTNPYQVLTLASVTGDVPAEARLVVTDAATQTAASLRVGPAQRYYDAATSLYIDSDNMVTSGFGGTGRHAQAPTTRTPRQQRHPRHADDAQRRRSAASATSATSAATGSSCASTRLR
jgi:hypothetical protein